MDWNATAGSGEGRCALPCGCCSPCAACLPGLDGERDSQSHRSRWSRRTGSETVCSEGPLHCLLYVFLPPSPAPPWHFVHFTGGLNREWKAWQTSKKLCANSRASRRSGTFALCLISYMKQLFLGRAEELHRSESSYCATGGNKNTIGLYDKRWKYIFSK